MKDLLVVGVGTMGRPYVDAAQRLGVRVRAVESEALLAHGPADPDVTYYPVAGGLDETWQSGVTRAITERAPDGVLAFAEAHVLAGALAQDRLGLPGPSLHAAVVSRNKALQRTGFGAYGVPQPDFLLAPRLAAARQWMLERLPVVVKPLTLGGSEGVELVTDPAGVEDVIARRGDEGKILVEEAVQGPEYSWEALVHEGEVLFRNVTEKETTAPPYFVELSHRCGHRFTDPAVAAQVDALTTGVLRGLGMRTGLVHLEFRLGVDGPRLMEVAVRTPGDYLAEAVGLTYGFDLHEAVVRLALGLPLGDLVRTEPVAYAATYFPTCAPGTVRAVHGVEEVTAHPDVVRVRLRKGPGDTVGPLTSSSQRLGHVLVRSGSPQEREEALKFVADRLRIEV
ncbi:ATP-grasp domain-containing protein [Streptomyces antimicrobicus]|uniref:ATP-grasp domain-containing protein n=1 Tax=Streptomyces antimicrobicus TaxID=2883108 RepID=A0ABS8B187_9ACTN|nr:ATP-grasp domain-containing protein [Streptomyces antimicrobicus]MCB5178353.1 ATP-grasp domain-containing protein [Streptomyces antimicrobicus]